MQAIATGLLGLMTAGFVAATVIAPRWPPAAYVRAFCEAAMVGAVADWFAVVAIFRRPLGLPVPHTGVVPRNKARIGRALGAFIADNFLTPEVLAQRLRSIEVARWGADWLRQDDHAGVLARRIAGVAPDLAAALPRDAVRDVLRSAGRALATGVPAAPLASRLLDTVWSGGRLDPVIDWGLRLLGQYLDANQEVVLDKVQAQSHRWLPAFVDRLLARRITAGLVQLLADLRAPSHPWRLRLDDRVRAWVARLAEDPDWAARAEALKARWLDDPALRTPVDALWIDLQRGLDGLLRGDGDRLEARIEAALKGWATWIDGDLTVQRILNEGVQALVAGVVAPRRHEIGGLIAQVVSGWDTRSLVRKLEVQVGRDLQYIRINGTLVGGLAGLAIYTASRLAGWP